MIRSARLAAAFALPLVGTGCGAALPAISAAASIASAAHQFMLVGDDILTATALACQEFPAAKAAEAAKMMAGILRSDALSSPWYAGICDRIAPSNPHIDASTPAYIAAGLERMKR